MASKRDLFQSYQFNLRRVVSGLVLRETDPAQTPLRRMGGSMFGSVMVAVIALAITGVIGAIKGGGNTTWQDGGSVIIEEETGATYAWLQDPNTKEFALHPVVNYSSAALLVGSPTPISVSQASLAEAPRGPRLGISGAPDSIPQPDSFDAGPWSLCSGPAKTETGAVQPHSSLRVGQSPSDGVAVGDGSLVLRDASSGVVYLLWNGHRFRLAQPDSATTALGLRDAPEIEVGTAMLTSIPEGPAIEAVTAAGAGDPSAEVPGHNIGEVLVDSTTQQFYLVRKDDLRNLSEVEAAVTLAAPQTSAAYGGAVPEAIEVDNAEVTSLPRKELPEPVFNDPPRDIPTPTAVKSADSTVCAVFSDGSSKIQIVVDASTDRGGDALATPEQTVNGTVLADEVLVNGGHAAYVRSVQSATATDGPMYLITDEGMRFAVPGDEAASALGLDQVTPISMPATIVARIPEGPALDPVSARATV